MKLLYLLGVISYGFAIQIASLFNEKARKWVIGRENFWKQLPVLPEKRVIWFHAASLGEFEQGRPIIEAWKEQHPDDYILLTFFSPSGYEQQKNYELADYVCYLPLDTPSNANRFIAHFKPAYSFFIKYEFWINYIHEAYQNQSRMYAISALFRPKQRFFKWYGGLFRLALAKFDHIFVQNEESLALLHQINLSNASISGDTRYDRAFDRQKKHQQIKEIEQWLANEKAFIVGSSWPEDEALILPLINEGVIPQKVIIAPHEVNKSHLDAIRQQLTVSFQNFTEIKKGEQLKPSTHVLIIDCIGILADAYQYGSFAYVGGAFNTGLHNILEPATFGLPVIFGPNHKKFPEAHQFIDAGIGWSISDKNSLQATLSKLKSQNPQLKERVVTFMHTNIGAREFILKKISNK